MSQKLQELAQKLYKEGVEKAQTEAEKILRDAEEKRNEIVGKAEEEARRTIADGRREAEKLLEKGRSELQMAARQAVSSLKQEITNLISHKVIGGGASKTLGDPSFLKKVITDLVSKWDPVGGNAALALILPEKDGPGLAAYLRRETAAALGEGLEIRFDERMRSGFRIVQQDEGFVLSFTEQDFEEFLQSFLRTNIREILFAEK